MSITPHYTQTSTFAPKAPAPTSPSFHEGIRLNTNGPPTSNCRLPSHEQFPNQDCHRYERPHQQNVKALDTNHSSPNESNWSNHPPPSFPRYHQQTSPQYIPSESFKSQTMILPQPPAGTCKLGLAGGEGRGRIGVSVPVL